MCASLLTLISPPRSLVLPACMSRCICQSVSCPVQTKAGFLELRKTLKANNDYVLGEFSYADITMAVALQAIEPVGPPISK